MKEVSIKQKAKTYDIFFPELKESKNERIRKFLIHEIEETSDEILSYRGMDKESVIAWLEKQIEQKPADKAKPKFREGEWITNGDYTWQIVSVTDLDYILRSQDGNTVDDTISYVDESFHSYNIQDIKDGDVLINDFHLIFIFKKIKNNMYISHCSIIDRGNDVIINSMAERGVGYVNIVKCQPATKEQRDALMKAMTNAGYTFDFEKKELKKIESKQEWSEEDKDAIDQAILALEDLYDDDCPLCRYDGYKLPYDKAAKRLKSLRPRSHWKPSDEQMENLSRAFNGGTFRTSLLMDLYQDLKKLMEE